MIWKTALLLIASILPPGPLPQRVCYVEVNHVLSRETGQECLNQVIWWDWSPWHGCFVVRGWKLTQECGRPVRCGARWVCQWGTHRVEAEGMRETWTWYDVEMENRGIVPEMERRKLR